MELLACYTKKSHLFLTVSGLYVNVSRHYKRILMFQSSYSFSGIKNHFVRVQLFLIGVSQSS